MIEYRRLCGKVYTGLCRKEVRAVRIVSKPQQEEKVLAPVQKDARAKEIREGIVSKAQCCVDHLCGCNCDC